MKKIENAQSRTDAKLRYAALHLEEVRIHVRKGSGDDFERSHQEAFLYQLVGARDAFLQELNLYYLCGLALHEVRLGTIRKCLRTRGTISPELESLSKLENDLGSWLNLAKEMRDHSTHRRSVPLIFDVGGEDDGKVTLQDPRTKAQLIGDQIQVFESWLNEMEKLIGDLRQSSLKAFQSNNCVNSE